MHQFKTVAEREAWLKMLRASWEPIEWFLDGDSPGMKDEDVEATGRNGKRSIADKGEKGTRGGALRL